MNDYVLNNIDRLMPEFSKSQRLIAHYIKEQPEKAAFMTAAKLGQMAGVSESTVVRFAIELGFDGYPGLQKAIQELIRSKLTSVQRIKVARARFEGNDLLAAVLAQDIDQIKRTLESTSRDDFNAAVGAIATSRRIYILGQRASRTLSFFLDYAFNLILDYVILVDAESEAAIFEQMLRVGPQDVVIGLSFPRYSRLTVTAMQFARDRGANTISITDSPSSPLAGPANLLLLARSDMAAFVDSLVAPLSLINALVVAVTLYKQEEACQILDQLEGVWEAHGVYEKPEGGG